MKNTESIERLVLAFSALGIGKKTATRHAYKIVDMPRDRVAEFCDSLMAVKDRVGYCNACGTFSESEICDICSNRLSDTICVVSYPKDMISIEKGGSYRGLYHILHGVLSPLAGIGPEQLNIKSLLSRLDKCREIIVATNPDVEGEATAMYIAKLINPLGVKVSRIAQGISIGSDIEYADDLTLTRAIENRHIIK